MWVSEQYLLELEQSQFYRSKVVCVAQDKRQITRLHCTSVGVSNVIIQVQRREDWGVR